VPHGSCSTRASGSSGGDAWKSPSTSQGQINGSDCESDECGLSIIKSTWMFKQKPFGDNGLCLLE
jgi:hypothetical protein